MKLQCKVKALWYNKPEVKELGSEVKKILRRDQRERVRKVSEEIEDRLVKQDIIWAFDILQHWHKKFTGVSTNSSTCDIEEIKEYF